MLHESVKLKNSYVWGLKNLQMASLRDTYIWVKVPKPLTDGG